MIGHPLEPSAVPAAARALTEAQRRAIAVGRARNWPNRNALAALGLVKSGGGLDVELTAAGKQILQEIRR